jgi:hypothetical protein
VALGAPATSTDVQSPAGERLSADAPRTTTSGATFTTPSGWRLTSSTSKTILDPPEADSHLALVDVQATDAAAAVAAGWAGYRPGANRPLRIATPQAPQNGWEERHVYSYETSPNEKAHGVGAVILTNSDAGGYLPGLFRRRLLEVLFDGQPEAVEQAKVAVAQRAASIAKRRERLVVPADAAEVGKLAARYINPELGALQVHAQDGATIFDFGKWHSAVASRRNDDGTMSFISIDPTTASLSWSGSAMGSGL